MKDFIKNILVLHFFMFPLKDLFWKKLFDSKWETVVRTPILTKKLNLLTSLIKISLGQYAVCYNYRRV